MDEPVILKVFLVEDDDAEAALLRADLDADHLPVRFSWEGAGSLAEAVRHVPSSRADVVLLDLALPDSRDVPTLRRLREATPGLPLVVVVDDWDPRHVAELVREGADDVFVRGQETPAGMARRLVVAVERVRTRSRARVLWTV